MHKVCSIYIHLCLWENIIIGQSCWVSCCEVWYSSDLEILPFPFKVLEEFVLIKIQNHSITYSSIGEQFLSKPNMISCKIQAFYISYLLLCWVGQVLLTPIERFIMLPRSGSHTLHIYMLLLHWEYAKTCFHLDPPKTLLLHRE